LEAMFEMSSCAGVQVLSSDHEKGAKYNGGSWKHEKGGKRTVTPEVLTRQATSGTEEDYPHGGRRLGLVTLTLRELSFSKILWTGPQDCCPLAIVLVRGEPGPVSLEISANCEYSSLGKDRRRGENVKLVEN